MISEVDYFKDAEKLAQLLSGIEQPLLLGVPRGGLFLASYLSYRLNAPVGYIDPETYEIFKPSRYKDTKFKNIIIVDDLIDTGKTLSSILKNVKRRKDCFIHSAVLYRKETPGALRLDISFFVRVFPNDWIIFFYDRVDDILSKVKNEEV